MHWPSIHLDESVRTFALLRNSCEADALQRRYAVNPDKVHWLPVIQAPNQSSQKSFWPFYQLDRRVADAVHNLPGRILNLRVRKGRSDRLRSADSSLAHSMMQRGRSPRAQSQYFRLVPENRAIDRCSVPISEQVAATA